ncbi:hypothetical protein NPIL_678521 [Nephila pilipes]|uniref:Uncharacterized protein n=1 Tax=Nephila pilipes TaxID=299642 RepID=A0A8X6QHX5_NEPPI|nr:hypothetical protein NPIL_342891 [Nephila pilipes]GFU45404.1 hypothetical protein NPIL_678521 [Nephila pilipes]
MSVPDDIVDYRVASQPLLSFVREQRCPRNTTWRSATFVPQGCPSLSHSGSNLSGQPRGSLATTPLLTFLNKMGPPALSLDRVKWKKCRALMEGGRGSTRPQQNTQHAFLKSEHNILKICHFNK